jgi:hypothetical protein
MEKFNGVRQISKGLYRVMIYYKGKHIHLIDGSEQQCENEIDNALKRFKKD